MPSQAHQIWVNVRSNSLNQIEAAHKSVGGIGRGRRYATEQINHAYAVLLSSQFQGYCRDLHSECARSIIGNAVAVPLSAILTSSLTQNRKLSTGNPNPGHIGSDFGRFGLLFWDEVRAVQGYNPQWTVYLEELNRWRNAIAHQDFDPNILGTTALRLERVKSWRRACSKLVSTFDRVMRVHLSSLLGSPPW